jgi:hypothetical protein
MANKKQSRRQNRYDRENAGHRKAKFASSTNGVFGGIDPGRPIRNSKKRRRKKRKDRYKDLTREERIKLGDPSLTARGTHLKYIPNEDHVAVEVREGRKKIATKIIPKKELEENYSTVEEPKKLKKKPRKSEYCYLIKEERVSEIGLKESVYKIGKSFDPEGRLKNLQTTPNTKLELVAYSNLVKEKHMHILLAKIKVPHPHLREWFKLSAEQLQICTRVIKGNFEEACLIKLMSTIEPKKITEYLVSRFFHGKKISLPKKYWALISQMIDYRDKMEEKNDPFNFSEF